MTKQTNIHSALSYIDHEKKWEIGLNECIENRLLDQTKADKKILKLDE